jgi:hypothetical protein
MAAIRVELISEFKGESVVLVAVDADGLEAVRSALVVAGQQEQPLAVTLGDKKMEFKVEPGAARIELELHTITWRLGRDKIAEIVKKLDFMQEAQRASHHYVEIESPVKTLVLSRDEYVRPNTTELLARSGPRVVRRISP